MLLDDCGQSLVSVLVVDGIRVDAPELLGRTLDVGRAVDVQRDRPGAPARHLGHMCVDAELRALIEFGQGGRHGAD